MKLDFKSVDEYLAAQPAAARGILDQLRRIIRSTLPQAREVISYQIPAYEWMGERVIFFAGWKRHYSLYPAGARLVAAFKDELAGYEMSKGTIRFPLSEPVPEPLIRRILKFRAKEVSAQRGGRKNKGVTGGRAQRIASGDSPSAEKTPRRRTKGKERKK